MSDLTDKLVTAVQKGQLQFGDVVSRLTPQEKEDFSRSLESFSQGEVDREDRALGENKWPVRGATALGAGLGAAAMPAEIGGAGLASALGAGGSAIGKGIQGWAGRNPIAAGVGAWGLGKLAGVPAELRDLAAIMIGSHSPAGAAAPAVANEAESLFTKTPPMSEEEYMTHNNGLPRGASLRTAPSTPSNLSREVGMDDIEQRVQGGGGIGFQHNGADVRPNGPISQKGSDRPGSVTRRSPADAINSDEDAKRQVMFGGRVEPSSVPKKADIYQGGDTRPDPFDSLKPKKASLRKPKK